MKKISYFLLVAMVFLMSSCAAIGGIFKAGVWVGIILVVVVVAIIIGIFSRSGKS
jgi:hypothetical protein